MAKLTRRGFIAGTVAATAVRVTPATVNKLGPKSGKRILTLVYDKSMGMMRAVERVVPW